VARAHFRDTINVTATGLPLANAVVTVREQGTTDAIAATMYTAKSGGTTVSNPITTAADGLVEFWLDTPQQVDLRVVAAGYADVTISDLAVEIDQTEIATKTRTETLTNKTLTSPVINTPQLNSPTITGQVVLPNGTASATSWGFTGDTTKQNGPYRIGADEWALSAGGRPAIRMRLGPKGPQVAIGQTDEAGGWAWTDSAGVVPLKIHLVRESDSAGDLIGFHSEVRNEASTGGAGTVPDSSAITGVVYQTFGTANGAMRAVEAQAIVGAAVSNAHANASTHAIEAGIHMGIAGNGSYKTGVINAISTAAGIPGGASPTRADNCILARGEAGYTWVFNFWDETSTAYGFCFAIDQAGRVLATTAAVADAAAPAFSFKGDEDTGMYRSAANVLAFATAGGARMLIGSDGNVTFNQGLIANTISPPQITSNQTAYNPTGFSAAFVVRISADAARTIHGLLAPSGSVPKVVCLINVATNAITLAHESATEGTAANRLNLPNSADITLQVHQSVLLFYDATRWRKLAG
jgi:hypothetical protein